MTEIAKNLQFQDNWLEGSWNKGKGGNGYFRNSKVWDSLIQDNRSIGLRHLTLQWSASGNVVRRNTLDSDLNLHGGWERHNLLENNIVEIPYDHRDCSPNCAPEDETWFPIWVGAGEHAGRWSGATGPRNVFFNNILRKQITSGGPFGDWAPYGTSPETIFQFFWNSDNVGSTPNYCADGFLSGDVCCAGSCGQCGGVGCSQLPGGAGMCCTGSITDSGRTCQDAVDVACLIPNQTTGASGSKWKHLSDTDGNPITTWTGNEGYNYSPDYGVNALCSYQGDSLLDATFVQCSA